MEVPKSIRERKLWKDAYRLGFQDGLEQARQADDNISAQDRLDLERETAARKAFDKKAFERLSMLYVRLRLAKGASVEEVAAQLKMTAKKVRHLAK